MCGIAGIISTQPTDISLSRLKLMSDTLAHRGPDGEGAWINAGHKAGFSHRRLAVIDLSTQSAQPMHYMGRYTITYNGELYNYQQLRTELNKSGFHFHTASDTEVILAAYACYGKECLQHFDGMFAFAIWDEAEQVLFAARDRFGEKPFYYHHHQDRLIFASEMKAIWAAGAPKQLDELMMLHYLSLGTVQHPSDQSITFFTGINTLPPSHHLIFRHGRLTIEKYWDIDKQIENHIEEKNALERLEHLLATAVQSRMISDIPLGCSLSGGLDSSTVLFHMKHSQRHGVKSFSAVFPGFEKDESSMIQHIANQLQAANISCTPTSDELVRDFQKLIYHQEEPFPSSSIYAQYCVFQLAKENGIRVLLDGQGADEVLAGYHRHIHWLLQEKIARFKFGSFIREKKKLQSNDIPFQWQPINYLASYLPSIAATALEKKAFRETYEHADFSVDFISQLRKRFSNSLHKPVVTKLNDILYYDVMKRGLTDLLRFSDRNAMAHGCEARLPFLQHELVEFIFSLPSDFKLHQGYTKYLLRKLMDKKLPDTIVWSKDKVGFEPPQKTWMSSVAMIDFVQESKRTLVNEGILKAAVLDKQPDPRHAHEAANYDWRYLTMAQFIKPL
jgi:asparagine synthase (glutamine-hydrolysing)